MTTNASGNVTLYDKVNSLGGGFTVNNTICAFVSGVQESLYCFLYTWNTALYMGVRYEGGGIYANKTIDVDIITYIKSYFFRLITACAAA